MTGLESNLASLVFDLVEWVGKEPRSYRDVMDAWRTSCPRLTVWEEAVDRGLLARKGESVVVTEAGGAFLQQRGGGTLPDLRSNFRFVLCPKPHF